MKTQLLDLTVRYHVDGHADLGDGRKRNREKSAN